MGRWTPKNLKFYAISEYKRHVKAHLLRDFNDFTASVCKQFHVQLNTKIGGFDEGILEMEL